MAQFGTENSSVGNTDQGKDMDHKLSLTGRMVSLILLLQLATIPIEAQEQTTVRQIASNARQAIVTIRAYSGQQEIQQGSGFFIREDGVFVTNIHVVSGADTISVELEGGEIFDNVYGLALDERRDLVVLQIPVSNVPFLEIADDRMTEVGDTVYVVGSPLGLRGTFSDGLLSAKRLEDGVAYLQISAPISQGSSGGPVLNSDGKVIGVSTLTITEGQNLNMAVPARHASGLLLLERTPVPFETFAAELPQPEALPAVDRASETVALLNALPGDVQEEMSRMSAYEKQTTIRLIVYGSALVDADWELMDDSKSGVLGSDSVEGLNVTLTNGSYFALAVCDDDCTDLDLYVIGPNEEVIASDVELDAEAMVTFDVTRPGQYTIAAAMESCKVTDCVYSIQLFQKK